MRSAFSSYRTLFTILLVLAFLMISCSPTTTPAISPQASACLTTALDDMQQQSLKRNTIDWKKLRRETFTLAKAAQTPAETYPAIQFALQQLGDHHSFFLDPQQSEQAETAGLPANPAGQPHGQRLAHAIGYLVVPQFEGSDAAAHAYATLMQQVIGRDDQAAACGWIIDLRGNSGGNMWPMLAGVGPVLGDSTVGSFVAPGGIKQMWGYQNGQALLNQEVAVSVTPAYQVKRSLPPVAVLTNGQTASSGEAITVAFRGRPHTRSFGGPTYGVPTANATIPLSDGALLVLTVALDSDRTGQTYEHAIPPDQEVADTISTSGIAGDHVVQAALTWLQVHEGC